MAGGRGPTSSTRSRSRPTASWRLRLRSTRPSCSSDLYVVLAVGTLVLWKRREVFAVCTVFLAFDLFQYNPDLSRILLPTFPFALLVAFDPVLTRREARLALPLVVILAYVYAWGFLPHNLMPEEGYARLRAILGGP